MASAGKLLLVDSQLSVARHDIFFDDNIRSANPSDPRTPSTHSCGMARRFLKGALGVSGRASALLGVPGCAQPGTPPAVAAAAAPTCYCCGTRGESLTRPARGEGAALGLGLGRERQG